MILNVARDNINVFWDEHINSNISKFLEKKKHGLDNKFVYKKQTDGTDSLADVHDENQPSMDSNDLNFDGGQDNSEERKSGVNPDTGHRDDT